MFLFSFLIPFTGTLPINKGNELIPIIKVLRRRYRDRFTLVVMTQDWHCPDHVSFASQHKGKSLYSAVDLQYDSKGKGLFRFVWYSIIVTHWGIIYC